MSYFVSRQHYVYSRACVVEVTSGGLDYAGADMLVAKYPGEGKEYNDPREAVEAAIDIVRAWNATRKENREPQNIKVAVGSTGGMGMELEPTTFKEAIAWAQERYNSLPKCAQCGDILGKDRYTVYDYTDDELCSEYCCDKMVEEIEKLNQEDSDNG